MDAKSRANPVKQTTAPDAAPREPLRRDKAARRRRSRPRWPASLKRSRLTRSNGVVSSASWVEGKHREYFSCNREA